MLVVAIELFRLKVGLAYEYFCFDVSSYELWLCLLVPHASSTFSA